MSSNVKKQPKYTGLLRELAELCIDDSERWFGDTGTTRSAAYMALAMAGEVGEFCNVVKKVERGSLDIRDPRTRIMLASELTDVFVYMLNLAGLLGVDLEKSFAGVRAHNEQRFSEGRVKRNGALN